MYKGTGDKTYKRNPFLQGHGPNALQFCQTKGNLVKTNLKSCPEKQREEDPIAGRHLSKRPNAEGLVRDVGHSLTVISAH